MTSKQQILRIPRSDSPDSFVLVNVTRTGKSELDLKLVATEGEDPYVGSGMCGLGVAPLLIFALLDKARDK